MKIHEKILTKFKDFTAQYYNPAKPQPKGITPSLPSPLEGEG
jgi:hypothetical protein